MPGVIFAFYIGDPGWRKAWRDKLIRFLTWSRYSHVELITDEELKSENWTVSASKRDGGVREKLITWKPGHWEFVVLPTLTSAHANGIKRRAERHDGAGYDTLGALLTVTPINWHSKVKRFCSELMAEAVWAVGHPLRPAEPHRLTPKGFHRLIMAAGGVKLTEPVKEVAR